MRNKVNQNIGFVGAFIAIVLLDLIFADYQPSLRYISKPLIVLSLIWYYYTDKSKPKFHIFGIALVFALLGDIILMFGGDVFFMLGLGSFLIMQILYAIYFSNFLRKMQLPNLLLSLAVVLLALFFNASYFTLFGDFQFPVLGYSIAIALMVIIAINQTISPLIALGAVLFMISDLILAYNKFINKELDLNLVVMVTYSLGQLLIVRGNVIGDFRKK